VRARAEGTGIDKLRSSVSVNIHPSAFAGFTVGESSLTATMEKRLVSLEGKLELSGESFGLAAHGAAGENAFMLDNLNIQSSRGSLIARGVLGYGRSGPLDMVVNLASADLRLVSVFLPAVKIEGIVSSTGTLKGTMSSPAIAAELDVRNVAFSGLGADGISATIAIEGFRLPPDGTADVRVSGFRAGGTTFDRISARARNRNNSCSLELSAEKAPL